VVLRNWRVFGYRADEVIGQRVSFLHPGDDTLQVSLQAEFKRAADEGHTGTEGWRDRKDGSRFWANAITLALKDGNEELQGFARVVRDFSDRHERDEKLQRSRARIRPIPLQSTIAGIISGEFDCVPEMNDTFLELVRYTREDLLAGRLYWPDLTPSSTLHWMSWRMKKVEIRPVRLSRRSFFERMGRGSQCWWLRRY
jgi:PAS domain S-box-containing protein